MTRTLRAGALVVAAVCALTLLGACGGSDGDDASVAEQDRAVVQHNKAEAAYKKKIKAALRKKWRARARVEQARARGRAQARAARRPRTRVVVLSPGGNAAQSSAGDICAPIRARQGGKAGRAERRARVQRRKQALRYLNLHCPSLNQPGV